MLLAPDYGLVVFTKRACEIRKFRVPVVQRRLRNVQERDARAELFYYRFFAVLVAFPVIVG